MLNPYQPLSRSPVDAERLRRFCKTVRFQDGDVMRRKGLHYRDMFWIVEGCVDVDLEDGDLAAKPVVRFAGSPVGEIGFLRGLPATATVTARDNTVALSIDDAALAQIEARDPELLSRVLRVLGEFADRRAGENLIVLPRLYAQGDDGIEVRLCRTREMLEGAQRLRYEVYCRELGRDSPHADHARGLIADALDETGNTFVAMKGGEIVGTLRTNLSADGSLGVLEELYGMKASPAHPRSTGICTKFIVKKSMRRSPAAIRLIGASTRFGIQHDIRECYADCIPALLPYYKAMGFAVSGPAFFHRENGLSYPMRLDVTRYGRRLSAEFGMFQYASLYLRAKIIRLVDRLRAGGASYMQEGKS